MEGLGGIRAMRIQAGLILLVNMDKLGQRTVFCVVLALCLLIPFYSSQNTLSSWRFDRISYWSRIVCSCYGLNCLWCCQFWNILSGPCCTKDTPFAEKNWPKPGFYDGVYAGEDWAALSRRPLLYLYWSVRLRAHVLVCHLLISIMATSAHNQMCKRQTLNVTLLSSIPDAEHTWSTLLQPHYIAHLTNLHLPPNSSSQKWL